MQNTNTLSGTGPWTFDSPSLDPGDTWRIDFKSYQKGKYRRHIPFDQALIKNYDTDNRVTFGVNGVYSVDIDPSGKDNYEEAGIRKFTVTNEGGTTIPAGEVTVSLKNDAYGSDEAARERKRQGPITQIVTDKLGLGP